MSHKYKTGFCRIIMWNDAPESRRFIRNLAMQCEKFILCIPDGWVYARIFGSDQGYNAQELATLWKDYKWISDVVIMDEKTLTLQQLYEKYAFNVYFYGCEYGRTFVEDKSFCDSKNITMISLLPDKFFKPAGIDELQLAINNVQHTQKIILFGTGKYFELFLKYYKGKIAYAIDNDSTKWNKKISGILVCDPGVLKMENPNEVLIILCSKKYEEQRNQLLSIGNFDYRTMCFCNEISLLEEFSIVANKEFEYMEKAHAILIKLMKEFIRVCEKYKLTYYVISGSLIGVVRHHGFIPWDDDIDVGMPREDIEKLKKIASEEWNGEDFLFVNYDELGNNAFLDVMPRLYYMKEHLPTRIMDKVRGKASADFDDRMVLDVYPMDNISDNLKKRNWDLQRVKFIYTLMMGHRAYVDYSEYARLPERMVKLIKLVNSVGKRLPFQWLVKQFEKACQCENYHETKCYYMPSGPIFHAERAFEKINFGEGIMMEFEDMQVRIPQDYDKQLHEMCYGDYMSYPPNAAKKPSHYFNADISIW